MENLSRKELTQRLCILFFWWVWKHDKLSCTYCVYRWINEDSRTSFALYRSFRARKHFVVISNSHTGNIFLISFWSSIIAAKSHLSTVFMQLRSHCQIWACISGVWWRVPPWRKRGQSVTFEEILYCRYSYIFVLAINVVPGLLLVESEFDNLLRFQEMLLFGLIHHDYLQ